MRIVFDVSPLSHPLTGVGNYIRGSLAGLVALQLWTFFSALAILFGVAVAAQLEAVRAGPAAAREAPPQEAAAVTRPVSV